MSVVLLYTTNVTNKRSVTGAQPTLLTRVVLLYTSNVTNERSVTVHNQRY